MPSRESEVQATSGTSSAVKPSSAGPVRGPGHDKVLAGLALPNPEAKVDDVLESLHRSLRDQETVQKLLAAVKKAPTTTKSYIGPTLSGGTASRKPSRRRIQRQKVPLKESRMVASARSLVGAAESLGLDMAAARSLISSSEDNLGKRRSRAAATDAARALSEAKGAVEGQLQFLLPELQSKIDELNANGCKSLSAEKGLSIARSALKKENYRTAIAGLSTARKALWETQTAFIRKILLESKSKFVTAKKSGVNIETAVRALMNAKESLRLGDLGTAVRLAKRAESAVEVTMKAHRSAARSLDALSRILAVGEQLDAVVPEDADLLKQSKTLFESGAYFRSEIISKSSLEVVEARLQKKIYESVERAEKAVILAREAGISCAPLESHLAQAQSRLAQKEYMKSLTIANSVLVDAASGTLSALRERVGEIGQFAKSVSGEIESLAQVQDAIVHSRERNLEMVRKYGSMSEEVVSQAYDNAAAYMRVSQDIVKQAYESSIGVDRESQDAEEDHPVKGTRKNPAQVLGITSGDRKLRIIDLYLSGRIDDKQLDKLLALVDTTTTEIELSNVQEAQIDKR